MKNVKLVISGVVCASALMLALSSEAETIKTLTSTGDTFTMDNGAIWTKINPQPTGTGNLQPFLRLQKNDVEEGVNTDVHGVLDNKDGNWTHDLKLGDLAVEIVGGIKYYVFVLDINESNGGNKPLISLDDFKIFLTSGDPFETKDAIVNFITSSSSLPVFNMNATTTYRVDITDTSSGSGTGDVHVLVPVSAIGGNDSDNFYLYTKMGVPNKSDGGFEEWAAKVPDAGATLSLLGCALLGIEGMRRKLGLKA